MTTEKQILFGSIQTALKIAQEKDPIPAHQEELERDLAGQIDRLPEVQTDALELMGQAVNATIAEFGHVVGSEIILSIRRAQAVVMTLRFLKHRALGGVKDAEQANHATEAYPALEGDGPES